MKKLEKFESFALPNKALRIIQGGDGGGKNEKPLQDAGAEVEIK